MRNLVNLELFDVSQWKVLAGESLDMAGFSYRTLGFPIPAPRCSQKGVGGIQARRATG